MRVTRECGDLGEFQLGPARVYFANHPTILHEMLVEKASKLTMEPFSRNFTPVVGRTSLPATDGAHHRRLRRIIAPAFQHKRLMSYIGRMVSVADEYQRSMQDGAEVDMVQLMNLVTRDILCKNLFLMDVSEEQRFFDAVYTSAQFVGERVASPVNIPLFVPTPKNRRYQQAFSYLRERARRLLEESAQRGDKGDVLSMLLLARDEDGTGLTEEELLDQTITLYLGGYETASNALAWTWLMLARNPEVQARVHAELDGVLGGRPPTHADLASLPYMLQVIKETMRLYPPFHMFARAPLEDVEIAGNPMRKGQIIFVAPYVTHRHPDFFPDPERFDPDRFLPENEKKLPRTTYIPFGNGLHVCIGMHFALLEMHLAMAHMCQFVSVSPIPGQQVIAQQDRSTLAPTHFSLKVNRRKASMELAS